MATEVGSDSYDKLGTIVGEVAQEAKANDQRWAARTDCLHPTFASDLEADITELIASVEEAELLKRKGDTFYRDYLARSFAGRLTLRDSAGPVRYAFHETYNQLRTTFRGLPGEVGAQFILNRMSGRGEGPLHYDDVPWAALVLPNPFIMRLRGPRATELTTISGQNGVVVLGGSLWWRRRAVMHQLENPLPDRDRHSLAVLRV